MSFLFAPFIFFFLTPAIGVWVLKRYFKQEASNKIIVKSVRYLYLYQTLMILSLFLPAILQHFISEDQDLTILTIVGVVVSYLGTCGVFLYLITEIEKPAISILLAFYAAIGLLVFLCFLTASHIGVVA